MLHSKHSQRKDEKVRRNTPEKKAVPLTPDPELFNEARLDFLCCTGWAPLGSFPGGIWFLY